MFFFSFRATFAEPALGEAEGRNLRFSLSTKKLGRTFRPPRVQNLFTCVGRGLPRPCGPEGPQKPNGGASSAATHPQNTNAAIALAITASKKSEL